MRKDTSFSNRKLTTKEFSRKYWMNGKHPYQYHTASIEDARDEREQFVFNNIRALWNLLFSRQSMTHENQVYIDQRVTELEYICHSYKSHARKITIINAIIAAVSLLSLLARLLIL